SRYFEPGSGYGMFHWSNKVGRNLLPFQEINRHRPLADPTRIARSYSNFKDSKTQQVAAGVLSAFKAAVHYRDHCNETYSEISNDVAFFVPIVVVDGEIYDCYIDDETSELRAESVDAVVYQQNYHSSAYARLSNRVTVITISALDEYLLNYRKWGEHVLATIRQNQDLPRNL
ncbi:MAG TPA: hypothetical protein VF727_17270, partial [Allosphingosinicella sp.]